MPTVTFLSNSQSFELPRGASLQECDSILSFGCRAGACGACVIEIVDGQNNLSVMESDEKDFLEFLGLNNGSHRLACQCVILGSVTIK
ncbi:MAG: ferredoxin [uncultured bacterium]|nr:MAG: ferredoxin [uncultured bacterium]OGT25894.1 MAG: hypothetical protein A3B71_07550 [Gammaproteobacteria bacterium RIFCSPHIGHO2_02_FULL_42_43]OGT29205.1 MAG: hypothetical protein A2624_07125 [Gammaproteobacteria bacterium RIFCSPHIGHO2_01_FULL_42_8]OGT52278.1 MAG: hypothetical protein A3E54_01425 [Gammaproteobacteria bacterium RIFCSPHIGHO2_12_FULL_41_25]OGT61891.1 MAG: hypothetical protein A3I77_01365 [Gammaproteobacteria bacterium RIFCSPLOWO2_02_FULL_42_14]OGT86399.1 MAG: hypothetical pr